MDNQDRQAIEGLFSRLAGVEQQAGPRDAAAEAFIKERVSQQTAAPYFMAQTIVMQDYALQQAQQRIQELEYQAQQRPAGGGGFFSNLFGSSAPPRAQQPGSQPYAQRGPAGAQAMAPGIPQNGAPGMMPGAAPRQGGGFLAGAAQTAMGVAGGMMLGSALGSMFGSSSANAAEAPAAQPAADAGDAGDDSGGGFFDDFFGDEE